MANEYKYAEGERIKITNKQSISITKMYKEVKKDIAREAEILKGKDNISSSLRRSYLDGLSKQIEGNIKSMGKDLEAEIKDNLTATSAAVIENNSRVLSVLGLEFKNPYSYVPVDVVNDAITGNLYKGKWTLSSAIWGDNQEIIDDIHGIVAKGISMNKSAYDIAKDLEEYVSPGKVKSWDWAKVYPGTKKVIDYNAQRLARTLVSHVYQESFVRTTKNNPFFDAYKWNHAHSTRFCQICLDRSTNDSYGLGSGIFPKDKLPFDHPNGMCYYTVVMAKSMDNVIDDIANWYHGTGNKEMNKQLDKFAKDITGGRYE